MQTGLTGHSRLVHDNWVTHVLRERLVGLDHSTVRKSQIQTCQKSPPTKPYQLISLLQACGMSEYVSIIILVRRSVSRDHCVQTWNNGQQSEYYTYDRAYIYMDNNKYILYRFTEPGEILGGADNLDSKTHVFLIGWRGEQTSNPGMRNPFPTQMGLCWHVLGPGLLPRRKYCRESFHFGTGKKVPVVILIGVNG
jgi:hypothetical protein